jgi:hypothetical protein
MSDTMILFLIGLLPLSFCLILFLPWEPRRVPRALSVASTCLKGALMFFPGYLAMLIVRAIFGFSYSGILLFASLFLRDHLTPLLAALGALVLLRTKLDIPATEEGIFLTTFAFLSGFLALVNLADLVRAWRAWDFSVLFLLPLLRLSSALVIALLAPRFYRWEGRDGVWFSAAAVGVALVASFGSFIARWNAGWAGLLAFACLAVAVALLAMRFPRTLQA